MEKLNLIDKFLKKEKVHYCKFLSSSLFIDYNDNIKFCPISDFGWFDEKLNAIWIDVEELVAQRNDYIRDFKKLRYGASCKDCFYHEFSTREILPNLEYLYLSNWKNCYLNCSYCSFPKEEDLVKVAHHDVYNSILEMVDFGFLTTKTNIIFDCGDATIHPEFDKIMYYFINQGMENIVINTPALRYCESISEAISKNICEVVVSFDSGCPYIYQKVKGFNKFDIAISNIKRYLQFQLPHEKRVVLKYTLISGVNDNQKEILDWFMLARDLGVKKLAIDIDKKWYNALKESIPQYLRELLVFVKNMSVYNNIQIEFCDRVDIIYKTIFDN